MRKVTGTYYFYPSSDIDLKHDVDNASSGQAALADDDDGTNINHDDTSWKYSTFGLSPRGDIPNRDYTITSMTLTTRHKSTSKTTTTTGYYMSVVTLNGQEYQTSENDSGATSYRDFSDSWTVNKTYSAGTAPTATVRLGSHRKSAIFKYSTQYSKAYVTVNQEYYVPEVTLNIITMDADDGINMCGATQTTNFESSHRMIETKVYADAMGDLCGQQGHRGIAQQENLTMAGEEGEVQLTFQSDDEDYDKENIDLLHPYILVDTVTGIRARVVSNNIKFSFHDITQDTTFGLGLFSRKNKIYCGDTLVKDVYIGNDAGKQIYSGGELVYGPPVPTIVQASNGKQYLDSYAAVHPLQV